MLATIINIFFNTYTLLLFARILGSWFPNFSQHRIMRFLAFYTDPYLNIFRKIIPPLGMIDLSPMVAFFALQLMQFLLLLFFKNFI